MYKITFGQWNLIKRMEQAFARYYNDDRTKFTGRTYKDASDWIDEQMDEYKGICGELKHGRLQEDDFSMR